MNTKKLATHALTLIVGTTVGLLLTGCATTRVKRLSGQEFMRQAKKMEVISSFSWTTYIGRSEQRAYLEYGHPAFVGGGTRTTVYWTPMSELPGDIAQKLTAGTSPWKPWQSKTNGTDRTVAVAAPNQAIRDNQKPRIQLTDIVGAWAGTLPSSDDENPSPLKTVLAVYSDGRAALAFFERNGTDFPLVGTAILRDNALTIKPDKLHEDAGCKEMTLHIASVSDSSLKIDIASSFAGQGDTGTLTLEPADETELKALFGGKRPH